MQKPLLVLLSIVAALPAALVGMATAHAAEAQLRSARVTYRSDSDGLLWELEPDGKAQMVADGVGVAAGTSPAVVALPGGGRVIAFHAADKDGLWYVDANNVSHDTGMRIAASSSPAVVALVDGFDIVFTNAADGLLWQMTPDGKLSRVAGGLAVAAGTSPEVAATLDGGLEIAFHGAGKGTLWYVDTKNAAHDTGVAMAAGSSPSVSGLSRTRGRHPCEARGLRRSSAAPWHCVVQADARNLRPDPGRAADIAYRSGRGRSGTALPA